MGRRIVAIVLAFLLALVGAALVFFYARSADSRAVAGQQPATVYVTTKAVRSGTTLKDAVRLGLIAKTQIATKALPAGALQEVNGSNQSLLAVSELPPGQYVLAASFGTTPTGQKAIEVPAGQLAVSVQLSDPARVGSFVTNGSHITIFATAQERLTEEQKKATGGEQVRATTVLLENILVIGMGDAALVAGQAPTVANEGTKPAANTPSFLVTVAVTPEQALRLVHGINNYVLYAGLRGADVDIKQGMGVNDLTVNAPVK